jgi:hypothetical protein
MEELPLDVDVWLDKPLRNLGHQKDSLTSVVINCKRYMRVDVK